MKPLEIIIIIVLILGIGTILMIILRDPIYMLKLFLRGLKSNNWRFKIVLFPLWGPIWLIDKIFNLEIYISHFEEATHPKQITFSLFDKYIMLRAETIDTIKIQLKKFQSEFNRETYNFSLIGARISYSPFNENFILKIEGQIKFSTLNNLAYYLDKYSSQGILINKNNITDSYYLLFDSAYQLKLIGKTYDNKKIYIDLIPKSNDTDWIYFNSNINYIQRFDFDKFDIQINTLHFIEIII